jgi:threonine dehydrogenase-like Zn-dependent dehydrogenase
VHAWKRVDLLGDERVAIIGAGTIGLVSLLIGRDRGIDDVTLVDLSEERLAVADQLGATRCADRLDGEYDVVVDAVGSSSTRSDSVRALRPGGTAVWLGLAEPGPGFDGSDLVRGEKRVVGSFAYTPNDFAEAIQRSQHVNLDWTTTIALEDSLDAFMALANGATEPVKAVIRR